MPVHSPGHRNPHPTPPSVCRLLTTLFLCLITSAAEICWDKFDVVYKNQCMNGNWEQRYYFDHASLTCRQFWYDGCRSDSRNMFEDLLTCQWLCETQPMYKSRSCLEDFDEGYRQECNGGRWRQQYYYDKKTKRCIAFWYDGCRGESENLFQDELTCLKTCEYAARKDPKANWHEGDKKNMLEVSPTPPFGSRKHPLVVGNICEREKPCQNNGTCVYIRKKDTYYCKCQPGWTNDNCTEKIDFDPCASGPCLNGATCKAKTEKGKTSHECFCAAGFGGDNCDQRPCDSKPCFNNGTCRTTKGYSSYFCDCLEGFGGKLCDIAIGKEAPEMYGKNVELVSSGKAEWVENMKKILKDKKPQAAVIADEPYKDSATKKMEREQKLKEEAIAAEKAQAEEKERKRIEREKEREEEERKRNETLLAEMNKGGERITITLVTVVVLSVLFQRTN